MGSIAFIFPGQGSQVVGMGRALAEADADCRAVFEEADETLGESLSRVIFEGPDESLALTRNTQPALLTVSVAALKALRKRGVSEPDFVAGHSLGEYSALVASGVLTFTDGVRLVRARGQYMQEAVPVGVGAMAAIIGLEPGDVASACEEAARERANGEIVSPANFNSPEQTVIAGNTAAVKLAGEICAGQGARRVIPLTVSAPFHCMLMTPARERLRPDLDHVSFSDAAMPVVTNVDAEPQSDSVALKDALVRQVTAPVRWVDTVRLLSDSGVDTLIEVGPGRVLAGLVKKTDRRLRTASASDPESVDKAVPIAGAV